MTIDDHVEIVGEGVNSGARHVGRTGVISAQDGAVYLVHFDVLESPHDTYAWFPADSLELVKQRFDFSRLEDSDLHRATGALADIATARRMLERLGLCDDELNIDALLDATNRELHLRLQVARALGSGS